MAISVVNSTVETRAFAAGTPFTFSFNCTGANYLVVHLNIGESNNVPAVTVTYAGQSLTVQGTQISERNTEEYSTSLWVLASPTAGANNVVVSPTGPCSLHVGVLALSGVNTFDAIEGTDEIVAAVGGASSIYAPPGQTYSVTQANNVPSFAIVTGIIALASSGASAGLWVNAGGGQPVIAGGTDVINASQSSVMITSIFLGYIALTETGVKNVTIRGLAEQARDEFSNPGDSGGMMLLLNGTKGVAGQIISFD